MIQTHQWQKSEMMLASLVQDTVAMCPGFWRPLSRVPAKVNTFLWFSMQSLVPGLGVVVPIPVFPQQREKSLIPKRNKNATFYMTFFILLGFFGCIFKTYNQKSDTILLCVGVKKQELFSIYSHGCHINSIWQVANVHGFHSRIWPLGIHPVNPCVKIDTQESCHKKKL